MRAPRWRPTARSRGAPGAGGRTCRGRSGPGTAWSRRTACRIRARSPRPARERRAARCAPGPAQR
ncbi:MAG: hypothetical protein FJW78_04735, partial [Actinobacteria bacterium]|nr:hypothetical protein [Actinomycetota bacterium]